MPISKGTATMAAIISLCVTSNSWRTGDHRLPCSTWPSPSPRNELSEGRARF